ncbi:unnamed protein product [Trypanosoma congolense IL3000]|uniref:WGS project CAEQ00000000 data, annotated contig 49 n=1 Tax=Trypanosoma congolense (strain IL3000) TaxID=1068625 RepID=F9WGD8_TRYCI|nr:unnamed protein product [Trypanosoma congolense IL3000]
MMLMKLWMVVLVVVLTTLVRASGHNEAQHDALCGVLKKAVSRWGKEGETLTEPLKTGLKVTIFGNESGGDIEKLRKELPEFYDNVWSGVSASGMPCAGYYSGRSAPHGLVCLCTVGTDGFPFHGRIENQKLCAQFKDALGGGANGWGRSLVVLDDSSEVSQNEKGETQL